MRAGDVVDVEGDDLADPHTGVKRDERERLVARRRAALDFALVAQLGALVGRRAAISTCTAAAGPEAAPGVAVVDGGKRVVDGRRAAFEHGLQVDAVVAHGPVAAVGAGERNLVEVGGGKPGQELADLGGVGAPRLLRQRRCSQGRGRSPRGPRCRAPAGRSPPGRGRGREGPWCSL